MYKTIKIAARRSTFLLTAISLLAGIGTSVLPSFASANALNPLTQRTLLLSSSSPGFHYLDGAGNTTYAAPGSGPNGKQTAETFDFKTSTDSSATGTNTSLKAFTFQYCTSAAGQCAGPGNDSGTAIAPGPRGADTSSTSDLNASYTSPVEGTDFEIYTGGNPTTGTGTPVAQTTGWTMAASNKEDSTVVQTGKNNLITLTNHTSTLQPTAGTEISVVFFAHSSNYITNPGAGKFFVKINDFSDDTNDDPTNPASSVVDGGVTVANVMTDSIQIQTKVLETMAFSVGTVNPDNVAQAHTACDAITTNNPISLGDSTQEYSLSTTRPYDGFSYWRLSSNSSNGATVYYSGYTLSNTEGNQIAPIYNLTATSPADTAGDGSEGYSHPGSEQFGLGLDSDADTPDTGFTYTPAHLTPLLAATHYGDASGSDMTQDVGAQFAFNTSSYETPTPIASENTGIVHCSTGKMRYMANIAADTPAGIYASKINYLAAPEY